MKKLQQVPLNVLVRYNEKLKKFSLSLNKPTK